MKASSSFTGLLLRILPLAHYVFIDAFTPGPISRMHIPSTTLFSKPDQHGMSLVSLKASEKNAAEEVEESSTSEEDEIVFATDPKSAKEYTLTENEKEVLKTFYKNSQDGTDLTILEAQLLQTLPSMSSGFIMNLRKAGTEAGKIIAEASEDEYQKQLCAVGSVLENVVDGKLNQGKALLEEFLDCGEIRKLDAAIGKATKDGKLDMAFFTVLNMNVNDAYKEGGTIQSPFQSAEESENEESQPQGANRLSILQHIYTRCQEEVEKLVDPGIALLNKILRTEVDSIRYNQLQHYLGKPKTTITAPDGKTIELKGVSPKSLVGLDQFIEALANAVKQIRQVENAGGTDRTTAANLVENCRQVAIEARMVIAQEYGKESDELRQFEDQLQPIFRPSS